MNFFDNTSNIYKKEELSIIECFHVDKTSHFINLSWLDLSLPKFVKWLCFIISKKLTCKNISPSKTWLSYVKKSLRYGPSTSSSFSRCMATEKEKIEFYTINCRGLCIYSIMIWVSVTVFTNSNLPWKYVFVRRKATASLKIDKRSNFDKIFDSNGNKEAKWSSSPFNRNLWRFEGLLLVSLLGSFGGGLKLKFQKVHIITYAQVKHALRMVSL